MGDEAPATCVNAGAWVRRLPSAIPACAGIRADRIALIWDNPRAHNSKAMTTRTAGQRAWLICEPLLGATRLHCIPVGPSTRSRTR